MKKKIFAISGSTRKNSSNERMLKAIAALYKDTLDVEIYDENDLPDAAVGKGVVAWELIANLYPFP